MQKSCSVLALSLSLFAGCLELEADDQQFADPDLSTTEQEVTRDLLPSNLHLADVDGDGVHELLQWSGNKLFAFNADWEAHGRYHLYTPAKIKRVLSGDFRGTGRHNVVTILDGNSLVIHDPANKGGFQAVDESSLAYSGSQSNFIADHEQAIVGSFDGTGRDNILVYDPLTGALRMYRFEAGIWYGRFEPVPNFVPGNLTGVGTGLKFFAGRFIAGSSRDHLAVLRPGGQIASYDAVTDGAGKVTFWWGFTTYGGQVASDEDVLVANLTGTRSSLVMHSRTTGKNRMVERELVSWFNFSLKPVTGVDPGQIDQATAGTQLVFAKLKTYAGPGAQRDDVLTFRSAGWYSRVDSVWDGTKLTYWWYYNKGNPQLNQAWPESNLAPWVSVRCKLKNTTDEPAVFRTGGPVYQLMSSIGDLTGNAIEYFRDATYGGVLINPQFAPDWYTLPYTLAEAQQRYADYAAAGSHYRWFLIQDCANAARAAGVSIPAGTHVAAFLNTTLDAGAAGGDFLGDPNSWDHGFATHEMGHNYGLPHMFGDATSGAYCAFSGGGEYCDPWDTMGDGHSYPIRSELYGRLSLGFSAYSINRLGMLPAHRILTLPSQASSRTTPVTIAALNRPEVQAPLEVRVAIPGAPASQYLSIELRQKSGWDKNTPQDAVIVREIRADGLAYLLTSGGGPQRLAGGSYSGYHGGRLITVAVRSIDRASSSARLDITN